MWNPNQYNIKENSKKGAWLQLKDISTQEDLVIEIDGKLVKSRVKVLGPKSSEIKDEAVKAQRRMRDLKAKVDSFERKGKVYNPTKAEEEETEVNDIEFCMSAVIAWEGIPSKDGGEAKFTKAEKEYIFTSDMIRSQIIGFSLQQENFIES